MAYEKYEKLLGEFGGPLMPYSAFGAEVGMREHGEVLAKKASAARQLRDLEPEGAVAGFRSRGGRSPYLHGSDVKRFAGRRAELAAMGAGAAGDARAREQIDKRKYLAQQLEDQIAAQRATIKAKKQLEQGIVKAVGQVGAMGTAMMYKAGRINAKYDALQKEEPEEVPTPAVDDYESVRLAVNEAADLEAAALEESAARGGEVAARIEAAAGRRGSVLGPAEEALGELGILGPSERAWGPGTDLGPASDMEAMSLSPEAMRTLDLLRAVMSPGGGNDRAAHELKARYLRGELPESLTSLPAFTRLAKKLGLPGFLMGGYEDALSD
ncbi:hypothetical protein CMI37_36155 [Candidatus Pacearchaeota archaeon]|nr:hypothetical protein [Candidatus Pacearchaeota archaeon]|tara:strand:- start:540 stop:1517 length:978 start_codon:yes stop_codon:yes gene_type:complete